MPESFDAWLDRLREEEEMAKFDAWCERKALERHERYMAAKAERERSEQAGPKGPHIRGGQAVNHSGEPTGHAPASVTSDPKFEEAF